MYIHKLNQQLIHNIGLLSNLSYKIVTTRALLYAFREKWAMEEHGHWRQKFVYLKAKSTVT